MKLLKVYPITQDGGYPLFLGAHNSKLDKVENRNSCLDPDKNGNKICGLTI